MESLGELVSSPEWLRAVGEVLASVAWPVAVVWVFWMFQDDLRDLADRATLLSARGISVELKEIKEYRNAQEVVDERLPTLALQIEKDHPDLMVPDRLILADPEVAALLDRSKTTAPAAVFKSVKRLEASMERLATATDSLWPDKITRYRRTLEKVRDLGYITDEMALGTLHMFQALAFQPPGSKKSFLDAVVEQMEKAPSLTLSIWRWNTWRKPWNVEFTTVALLRLAFVFDRLAEDIRSTKTNIPAPNGTVAVAH